MLDHLGIYKEHIAEKKAQGCDPNERIHVQLSSAPFVTCEEHLGKMVIAGVALTEGIWNGVYYPADEMEKAASQLQGKPLKVEHGVTEDFKDKTVGVVTEAHYDPTLKSIIFKGEVTDPKAIELIKKGKFPAVSCSTFLDKISVGDTQVGFNFLFNELSLVETPACDKSFIFVAEELSKRVQAEKSKQDSETKEENAGERVVEEVEDGISLSELEPPKLFAVVELESLDKLPEQYSKKVVSYYYGYQHPSYDGKYPYPGFPYYPYKYYPEEPQKRDKQKLTAVIQLDKPEEILELKAKVPLVSAYYGYYGYPYYQYYTDSTSVYYLPYYYYYPYPTYSGTPPMQEYYPQYTPKKPQPEKKLKMKAVENGTLAEFELNSLDELEELLAEKDLIGVFFIKDTKSVESGFLDFLKECLKTKTDIADYIARLKSCIEDWLKTQSVEREEKYPMPDEKAETDNASPAFTDMVEGTPELKQPGPTLDAGVYAKQKELKDPVEQAKEIGEKLEAKEGETEREVQDLSAQQKAEVKEEKEETTPGAQKEATPQPVTLPIIMSPEVPCFIPKEEPTSEPVAVQPPQEQPKEAPQEKQSVAETTKPSEEATQKEAQPVKETPKQAQEQKQEETPKPTGEETKKPLSTEELKEFLKKHWPEYFVVKR